jgi:flagellar basal-body rod protein FlgB
MELFGITQVALEAAVRGAAVRREALVHNLANANTPGFKRSDVDFQSQLQRAIATGDVRALQRFQPSAQVDSTSSMRVDGNNVDIDREATYSAENSLNYNALVAIAGKRMKITANLLQQVR